MHLLSEVLEMTDNISSSSVEFELMFLHGLIFFVLLCI